MKAIKLLNKFGLAMGHVLRHLTYIRHYWYIRCSSCLPFYPKLCLLLIISRFRRWKKWFITNSRNIIFIITGSIIIIYLFVSNNVWRFFSINNFYLIDIIFEQSLRILYGKTFIKSFLIYLFIFFWDFLFNLFTRFFICIIMNKFLRN